MSDKKVVRTWEDAARVLDEEIAAEIEVLERKIQRHYDFIFGETERNRNEFNLYTSVLIRDIKLGLQKEVQLKILKALVNERTHVYTEDHKWVANIEKVFDNMIVRAVSDLNRGEEIAPQLAVMTNIEELKEMRMWLGHIAFKLCGRVEVSV